MYRPPVAWAGGWVVVLLELLLELLLGLLSCGGDGASVAVALVGPAEGRAIWICAGGRVGGGGDWGGQGSVIHDGCRGVLVCM